MLSESQDSLSCCCTNAFWVSPRLLCFRFCAEHACTFRPGFQGTEAVPCSPSCISCRACYVLGTQCVQYKPRDSVHPPSLVTVVEKQKV